MNWFSNMFPFEKPLIYRGLQYRTVEHFYQAMKTLDDEIRKKIADCPSPYIAKKEGKKIKLREYWDSIKLKVMDMALSWKFKNGTIWAIILEYTKNQELIEWNNWGDTYWGKDIKTQEGENHLGKLLMQIRECNRISFNDYLLAN